MIYDEWYGVCDFIVLSVVEVCVDYGGVNVFHVHHDFGIVYAVGVCVNVWIVVCCLFRTSGCCLLCCSIVGEWGLVIFVLYVMSVVGGIPLWVGCVLSLCRC